MTVHYHNDVLHKMSPFCDSLNLPLFDIASLLAVLFSSDTAVEDSCAGAFCKSVFDVRTFHLICHCGKKKERKNRDTSKLNIAHARDKLSS